MYLVLFQTYKQHLIKPPSTYVTKSWLFHWKSYIYVFNKLWLKLPKCLQYQWREEEEHCFRRFHTAKVLMNKFLFIYFYLSYLPLLNFWTRICCQKKYAVFWPPSSFVKKKVSWKLFIKDKQQFYKNSNSSLYQKGISVLMTMKQITGKASGTILWYSSEIKNQLD